jgi:hypothetical protein
VNISERIKIKDVKKAYASDLLIECLNI